jgi:hypothetical protein
MAQIDLKANPKIYLAHRKFVNSKDPHSQIGERVDNQIGRNAISHE